MAKQGTNVFMIFVFILLATAVIAMVVVAYSLMGTKQELTKDTEQKKASLEELYGPAVVYDSPGTGKYAYTYINQKHCLAESNLAGKDSTLNYIVYARSNSSITDPEAGQVHIYNSKAGSFVVDNTQSTNSRTSVLVKVCDVLDGASFNTSWYGVKKTFLVEGQSLDLDLDQYSIANSLGGHYYSNVTHNVTIELTANGAETLDPLIIQVNETDSAFWFTGFAAVGMNSSINLTSVEFGAITPTQSAQLRTNVKNLKEYSWDLSKKDISIDRISGGYKYWYYMIPYDTQGTGNLMLQFDKISTSVTLRADGDNPGEVNSEHVLVYPLNGNYYKSSKAKGILWGIQTDADSPGNPGATENDGWISPDGIGIQIT